MALWSKYDHGEEITWRVRLGSGLNDIKKIVDFLNRENYVLFLLSAHRLQFWFAHRTHVYTYLLGVVYVRCLL